MNPSADSERASNLSTSIPSERALAALWRRAHTLSEGLVTEDGRRLRVVYPGRASPRAGPDFRDAVLATGEGELLTGDVELHLNAPDWYRHRHDVDPSYNGVILHVVLRPKGGLPAKQRSKTAAPVASLAAAATSLEGGGMPAHDLLGHLRAMDAPTLGRALDRAGDERFLARSQGYALELAEAGPDQAMYRGLMEALGYASNRRPFRRLADLVPLASLGQLRGEPRATRLLAFRAMLLGAAGLLSAVTPPEEAAQMEGLLRRLPKVRAMSVGEWRLRRGRPANHPLARIAGMAHLLDRHMESGLLGGLAEEVRRGDARALARRLRVPPFIGGDRAGDMAVNVVLPLLHSYAAMRGDATLREGCVRLYQVFPKLSDNEITREMKRLLAVEGASKVVSTARRHQGLVHMYKRLARGLAVGQAEPAIA